MKLEGGEDPNSDRGGEEKVQSAKCVQKVDLGSLGRGGRGEGRKQQRQFPQQG